MKANTLLHNLDSNNCSHRWELYIMLGNNTYKQYKELVRKYILSFAPKFSSGPGPTKNKKKNYI